MPKFYKIKRRYNNRRKRKWRQQKLAVGTVQKIARQIAVAEDKKQKQKYVHVEDIMAPGFTMTDPVKIPVNTQWLQQSGGGAIGYRLLSSLGGTLTDSTMLNNTAAEKGELELRLHGFQSYCIAKNNSHIPCRFEVRLIFIPNVNTFTSGAVDYLVPRASMFFNSGNGCGNLIYRGYNRRGLAASDATGLPVKYKNLDRKVIYLPAATMSGTQTVTGGGLQTILLNMPRVRKRFKLTHYYKGMGRKCFCRAGTGSSKLLTDGNFYLVYWHDLPSVTDTVSFLSTNNIQYSIKQNMNKIKPTP